MQRENKNFVIMSVLLSVACLVSLGVYCTDFKQTDSVQIKNFPRTIGGWVSEDIPLSKDELAILETDNVFIRKYTGPEGQKIYLYVVYSQNNRKVSHPPEICYTGSGVSILEKTYDPISVDYKQLTIDTNRLYLEHNNAYQILFYWFKVGDTFTSNYWKQQTRIALDALLGKREGSALIRISADVTDGDRDKAIKEIKEFTDLITPQLFKYLP